MAAGNHRSVTDIEAWTIEGWEQVTQTAVLDAAQPSLPTFDRPAPRPEHRSATRVPAGRRPPQIRWAADRVVSLAHLRLAAGEALVSPAGNRSRAYLAAKRAFDVVGALGLLIVLGPLMAAVYLLLRVTGQPIFRQERMGYCGRPFQMYKFRTMVLGAERLQHAVPNEKDGPIFKNRCDPRITRLGRLLRATSIDELPQLLNVLAGHMSLVGPRPPVRKEVAQYQSWQRRRLAVKPGLTCLWQTSGRCEIGFADWVRMDLWYVAHQSFLTDLKLLLKTPWSVLSTRGAY